MIHRAILGSVERMIAILTENFAGKWPFWLSPRQAMVVPVGPHVNSYAMEVKSSLHEAGFCADCDTDDGNTMNKKVRNAQIAQYNYILGEFSGECIHVVAVVVSIFFIKINDFDKTNLMFSQLWVRRRKRTGL